MAGDSLLERRMRPLISCPRENATERKSILGGLLNAGGEGRIVAQWLKQQVRCRVGSGRECNFRTGLNHVL